MKNIHENLSTSYKMFVYIYLLNLSDETLYIGMTNNLTRRLKAHKKGIGSIHTMGKKIMNCTTLWKGPVKNKYQAILIENTFAHRYRQKYKDNKVNGGELSPKYKKIVIRKAFKSNSGKEQ